MSNAYERVYEVSMLDDMHNYFPALLYQSETFITVQDVLQYIRERVTQRFNLFDYGRRQYDNTIPRNTFVQQTGYAPQQRNGYAQQTGFAQQTGYAQQQTGYAQQPQQNEVRVEFTTPSELSAAALLPLLRLINTPRTRRVNTGAWGEDVIVHASQDIINGASTEITLEQDLEGNCTICQDRMRQGELIRRLTACSHDFHRVCIDNWLLNRSVICPTCRHDVRQPASPLLSARSSIRRTIPSTSTTTSTNVEDMLPGDLLALLFGR